MRAVLTVRATCDLPDDIAIGDRLKVADGTLRVRSIDAELIDITAVGSEPEYEIGERMIDTFGSLSVDRPA